MFAEGIRRLSFAASSVEAVPGSARADDASSESSVHFGSAAADIDVEYINRSLDHVNNYSKRRQTDKLPPVLMYEINSSGESHYKSITLRELLNEVNEEGFSIDESAYRQLLAIREKQTRTADSDNAGTDAKQKRNVRSESPPTRRGRSSMPPKQSDQPPQRRASAILGSKSIYEMKYSIADPPQQEPQRNGNAATFDESYDGTGALRLRDLRRLDFQFNPNEERSVLIRRHAVLFAMDPIRAVVTAKRLILIVPDGADSLISILDQYMKEWVSAQQSVAIAGQTSSAPPSPTASRPTSPHSSRESSPARSRPGSSTDLLALANGNGNTTITTSTRQSKTSTAAATSLSMGKLFRKLAAAKSGGTDSNDGTAPSAAEKELRRLRTPYEHKKLHHASSNSQDLPFEMHAFEALLTTVMALETQEYNRVNAQVQIILNYFRSGSLLPIEVQEKMRNRKNDLSVMIRRITSARHTVNELTEDDEDMALMNLTLLRDKPALYHYPLVPEILVRHDEVEELLESYLIDFNSLESKIDLTRNQIQYAEDLLSLRLDTSRNELLIANTILAILACCFGLGAFVSGIFGMNLDNTGKLQETKNVFYTVIAVSTACMVVMFFGFIVMFRRNGMFPAKISLLEKDALKLKA